MTNETFQRRVLRALLGIIFAWVITATCHAQQNYFMAAHSASLTSAADAVTIQQPASGARQVKFNGALVRCSVACTITLSQNGAKATATALAITPLNLSPNPASVAFSGSNVGGGTTIYTYNIATGDTSDHWINLEGFTLAPGPNSNLTLTTSSITGSTVIAVYFWET